MTDVLNETLPVAAKKVDEVIEKERKFKSKSVLPRGANKYLCAAAVDKVILKGLSLDKALLGLVANERDYVLAVLTEFDDWKVKEGLVK